MVWHANGDGNGGCVAQDKNVRVQHDGKVVQATFDRVLGPTSSQADVYACVQDSVRGVLDGFNATVLAYGQTGGWALPGPVGGVGGSMVLSCGAWNACGKKPAHY
jgi:hypothetical protein